MRYRASVAGMCLVYLFITLEIPLPAAIHKESDQPFPCQKHLCGCQTAEQCWRHCCCFTAEERWAWARAHDIEPPDFSEKPSADPVKVEEPVADQGWNTVKLRDRARGEESPVAQSCCTAQVQRGSCCSSTAANNQKSSAPKSERVRWGSTLAASRCHGYATLWINVGAVLPIPPHSEWTPDWVPPERLVGFSDRADTISFLPPDPPPRLPLV
jgi:hypothetical protein